MKDKRHIKSFNEHGENLNISDVMNSILNELEQEKSELVKQLKLFLDKTTVGDKVRSFVDEAEYRGRIKTINDAISIVRKYYS